MSRWKQTTDPDPGPEPSPNPVRHFAPQPDPNQGVEIEGDDAHGVDFQFPWESQPQRAHQRVIGIRAFHIDKYPVTNGQFAAFVERTHYSPRDPTHFVRHWKWGGRRRLPAPERADLKKPVTYVSLADARAYCSASGKRLPRSWEWLYAAQGLDGRLFPWGGADDSSGYRRPREQNGTRIPGPEAVDAHSPQGDSPFGVADLVGNVWQMTDEFHDAHTRALMIRGGSNYRPLGSHWYFPQAKPLDQHEKYFLMDDSYERAGTLGFRCVQDAAQDGRARADGDALYM